MLPLASSINTLLLVVRYLPTSVNLLQASFHTLCSLFSSQIMVDYDCCNKLAEPRAHILNSMCALTTCCVQVWAHMPCPHCTVSSTVQPLQ